MLSWIIVAAVLAVMIWALWPVIVRGFNITANEGDEVLAAVQRARKEVKKDIKAVKRKLTR